MTALRSTAMQQIDNGSNLRRRFVTREDSTCLNIDEWKIMGFWLIA
jgi:hypothetical protein